MSSGLFVILDPAINGLRRLVAVHVALRRERVYGRLAILWIDVLSVAEQAIQRVNQLRRLRRLIRVSGIVCSAGWREAAFMNDGTRFKKALSQIVGKRLTLAEVTGKVPASEF